VGVGAWIPKAGTGVLPGAWRVLLPLFPVYSYAILSIFFPFF